jgi:hypothetical protein
LNIQVSDLHISVFQKVDVVHVSEDWIMNVNETMKALQDLNTNKDKIQIV